MKIALVGNPNVGKTYLFNQITGLNQKIGNYSGITIERITMNFLHQGNKYSITDLPGIYSLFPSSTDEEEGYTILTDKNHSEHPDLILYVTTIENIKRGLFLFQQIRDLNIPTLLIVNQIDRLKNPDLKTELALLIEKQFNQKTYFVSAKNKQGIDEVIQNLKEFDLPNNVFQIPHTYEFLKKELNELNSNSIYENWLQLAQTKKNLILEQNQILIQNLKDKYKLVSKRLQVSETLKRHQAIEEITSHLSDFDENKTKKLTNKFDKILLHHFWGYVIFFSLMFLIFQLLFSVSSYPMTIIENTFNFFAKIFEQSSPKSPFLSLLTNGIIQGIGGVLIFIPQIALLFFFIYLMEESGYMSRVVFLMDRLMKPFGLNGKSMIPLISGVACAIPAIMSARNIENPKERLLTILVTPFITCSARLPIYSVLIALIIPKSSFLGFNIQGMVLMFMYLLGIIMALCVSFLLKKVIVNKHKSYLVIDMPDYRIPPLKRVLFSVYTSSKDFVIGAGKIILAVSILLWAMSSFSPKTNLANWNQPKIEESYLGIVGKSIEPIIKPLGYDWKIGIGIISSFAAREVFVGTLKIIYNLDESEEEKPLIYANWKEFLTLMIENVFNFNNEENNQSLLSQMKNDKFDNSSIPVYTLASGFSLMIFYAFAMQCFSTIAVVKQETNSWKWTILQFSGMSFIAYFFAWIVYLIFK